MPTRCRVAGTSSVRDGIAMLLLLLLAALAACASGAPLAGSQVRSVMISSELRYLAASGVELEGTVYASVQTATAEVCAQKCADAGPTCSWFTASCDSTQVSCVGRLWGVWPPCRRRHRWSRVPPSARLRLHLAPCCALADLPLRAVHLHLHPGAVREHGDAGVGRCGHVW